MGHSESHRFAQQVLCSVHVVSQHNDVAVGVSVFIDENFVVRFNSDAT
jgi:hypothetical protein